MSLAIVSYKIAAFKNFVKFTGKHPRFFIKVEGYRFFTERKSADASEIHLEAPSFKLIT